MPGRVVRMRPFFAKYAFTVGSFLDIVGCRLHTKESALHGGRKGVLHMEICMKVPFFCCDRTACAEPLRGSRAATLPSVPFLISVRKRSSYQQNFRQSTIYNEDAEVETGYKLLLRECRGKVQCI